MAPVMVAIWASSSPHMTRGSPLLKTMSAASGSAKMLNSAIGVMFPRRKAPPISTISSILSLTSG